MKKSTWEEIYEEVRGDLENGRALSPRQRGWLNYQPHKRKPLSETQLELLEELTIYLGENWREKPYRTAEPPKPKKREKIKGLGLRIKTTRINAGYLEIHQLSKITNIAVSTIRDWENESSVPTTDKLVIICNTLDVSADYLLFGKLRKK